MIFIAGDTKLELSKFISTDAPCTTAAAATAQAMTASIFIDPSVPGADIEVDGTLVGNAPSTVTVTPGKHTICVKKKATPTGLGIWT